MLRRISVIVCIAALCILASARRHPYIGRGVYQPGWKLLWQDDFERFDRSKWSAQQADGCHLGVCGWGNGEFQFYTNRSSNLAVEDGRLILKARHETGEALESLQRYCRALCRSDAACKGRCAGVRFSSARIRTANKFSIGPGSRGYDTIKFTTRFKVTPGATLWPAIWLLPESSNARCSGCGRYGGWASSGEIDVFEAANDMKEAKGTIHYGGSWPGNVAAGGGAPMDPGVWNTVSFVWSKTKMIWYLNSREFYSTVSGGGTTNGWFSSSPSAGPHAPFDTKFHLIVNLAIGGGFTGSLPPEAAAAALSGPKSLQVDFIRVYGRK